MSDAIWMTSKMFYLRLYDRLDWPMILSGKVAVVAAHTSTPLQQHQIYPALCFQQGLAWAR